MRKRVITPKKGKRYYSYSLTLTIEQIEWLSSNPDSPALMRKVIDGLMDAESETEAKKLRERAQLLEYKQRALVATPQDYERNKVEADALYQEIDELQERAKQIDKNIEERERKRKEHEAPTYY